MEEAEELVDAEVSLFEYAEEGSPLEIMGLVGNGDPEAGFLRVFENVVATPTSLGVNGEACVSCQNAEKIARFETGEAGAHQVSSDTIISRRILFLDAFWLFFFSSGIGMLSSRRLSR